MPKKLELANPEKAEKALALLASGYSHGKVRKETGLDYRTIARLVSDNQESVDRWRQESGRKAREVAGAMLERIYERLEGNDDIAFKDLTVGYGIITDKALVLQGEASQITEQRTGLDVSQAKRAIEQARRKIQGEAIDV